MCDHLVGAIDAEQTHHKDLVNASQGLDDLLLDDHFNYCPSCGQQIRFGPNIVIN